MKFIYVNTIGSECHRNANPGFNTNAVEVCSQTVGNDTPLQNTPRILDRIFYGTARLFKSAYATSCTGTAILKMKNSQFYKGVSIEGYSQLLHLVDD